MAYDRLDFRRSLVSGLSLDIWEQLKTYLSNRAQVSMAAQADKPRGMLVEHEKNS